MGILSRYVFRQTTGALVLILLSLTGVVWIAVALRQLELMTTQGQDVVRFLAMTTLAIPSMMALIAPIALLIASIHVLNRLNSDSELIVMAAGGMPAWSLIKPLATLAFLISIGIAFVNHLAGPWAQQKLKELAVQVRTDLMAQVIQPWRFTSPEAKLTVHIRDRAPSGELLGLLMHDARDPKQVVTYLAESGRIIKQGGAAYLRMEKGHIVRRLDNEPTPQIIAFERYAVDMNQLEQRVDRSLWLSPRERLHERAAVARSRTTRSTRRTRAVSPPSCTSASSCPSLRVRLRAAGAGVHGASPDARGRAARRRSSSPSPLPCFTASWGSPPPTSWSCARPRRPLLYATPACAAVSAAIMTQWRLYPRRRSRLSRAVARPDTAGRCSSRRAVAAPPGRACAFQDEGLTCSGRARFAATSPSASCWQSWARSRSAPC